MSETISLQPQFVQLTYLEAEEEDANLEREDAAIDVVSQEEQIGPVHKQTNFKLKVGGHTSSGRTSIRRECK